MVVVLIEKKCFIEWLEGFEEARRFKRARLNNLRYLLRGILNSFCHYMD